MNTATATLSRPARISREVRGLLTLALPIMIGQLATTAMSFVDAVMAGRVSPQDLAAVGLGNSIWIPVYLLMTGTLLATTPKVAERYGAGKLTEIGPLVRQSLWLAVVVGLCGALLLLCAEPILHAMKVEPDLIEPSMGYLHGIAAGMPAVALYYVFRCFSDGLTHTAEHGHGLVRVGAEYSAELHLHLRPLWRTGHGRRGLWLGYRHCDVGDDDRPGHLDAGARPIKAANCSSASTGRNGR